MKKRNRHGILWAVAAAVAVILHWPALADAAGNEPANRFNVLFIAIDDLRPDLGCYGVQGAQTPNLDRFAATGVRFARHYIQVPTCGASRYSLLTGRSPASSGVTGGNEVLYRGPTALKPEPLPGAQSLPELFRRGGYRTVCIGKISHTPDGRVFSYNGKGDGRAELPNAWDELATPFGPWQRGWGAFFAYAGGRHREDGQKHRDLMEFAAERDEELPDGLLAGAAIEQLWALKARVQPFFLAVGFYKPHLPFVATKQDWAAFENVTIPPAASPAKIDSPWWHKSGEFYGYNAPFPKTQPLSDEAQNRSRRAYYACVRYVDRQVGKVLRALEDLGLAEKTVVVIWSDHGWHLGEQQIWGKHSPFERSLRSVLMVRAPGVTKAGLVTEAFAETVDLYPTLVDLCRPQFTETAWPLDGRSLRPVLDGSAAAFREQAVSFWQKAVSLRTPTHRLIARVENGKVGPCELYDLSADPDSAANLAEKEKDLVEQLKLRLPKPSVGGGPR